MAEANNNFSKLKESYLFSDVARKIAEYKKKHPDVEIIRMDIGDVTQPLFPCVINAMHQAIEDLSSCSSFHGYGPEQGYPFLRETIAEHDYKNRGVNIESGDIFISDGAKSDLGNLSDIFSRDCKIAVMNPAYPVYVDDAVISGQAGDFVNGKWSNLVYLECNPSNGFLPSLPTKQPDIIYLCFPNNPTGVTISKNELSKWVEYARQNNAIIIFDSAYEAFVRDKKMVRSVYEIDGADEVAIEVRSFSKTAGFTGVRCGYTVVPRNLQGRYKNGNLISLNKLWNRRQTTKFNGASYIAQCGAAAIYSDEGIKEVKKITDYYLNNAKIIKDTLVSAGYNAFGGENSPYVWASHEKERNSWELFDDLLRNYGLSSTPGSGFGSLVEGYIRLTGFNSLENTKKAMSRLKK